MKTRLKFIFALTIAVAALTYIVFTGVKNTFVYYFTISELEAKVPSIYGKRVRISGNVVTGSITRNINGSIEFQITDGSKIVNVFYSGIVPDIFKDNVEAVVEGVYFDNSEFKADVVLAKCPTKYESDNYISDLKNGSN